MTTKTRARRVRSEDAPAYLKTSRITPEEWQTIHEALAILERSVSKGDAMKSPAEAGAYCCAYLAGLESEAFAVAFLDNHHRIIATETMFRGTIDQAAVYPREIVKAAMRHNAAAVFLMHNHPSGVVEPSNADRHLTQQIKQALSLVEVCTLDHFVVSGGRHVSMAERGWV